MIEKTQKERNINEISNQQLIDRWSWISSNETRLDSSWKLVIIRNENHHVIRDVKIACNLLITLCHTHQLFASWRQIRRSIDEHAQQTKKSLIREQIRIDLKLTNAKELLCRLRSLMTSNRNSFEKSISNLRVCLQLSKQSILNCIQLVFEIIEKTFLKSQIVWVVDQHIDRIMRDFVQTQKQNVFQELFDRNQHRAQFFSSNLNAQNDRSMIDLRAIVIDRDNRMSNNIIANNSCQQSSITQLDDEIEIRIDEKLSTLLSYNVFQIDIERTTFLSCAHAIN